MLRKWYPLCMSKERPSNNPEEKASHRDLAGVIPYRLGNKGKPEFLMITNDDGEWVFPKGGIDKGESGREAAGREAFEEAGIEGKVKKSPIGAYEHSPAKPDVTMHSMEVKQVKKKKKWPESESRKRGWYRSKDVRKILSDRPELLALFEEFRETL